MTTSNASGTRRRNATTPTGEPDNTLRTIEDIERRQREVRAAEIEAMDILVMMLRDVAIALPAASKLPFDIADCAKQLERELARFARDTIGKPATATGNALWQMRQEIAEEIGRWPDAS